MAATIDDQAPPNPNPIPISIPIQVEGEVRAAMGERTVIIRGNGTSLEIDLSALTLGEMYQLWRNQSGPLIGMAARFRPWIDRGDLRIDVVYRGACWMQFGARAKPGRVQLLLGMTLERMEPRP